MFRLRTTLIILSITLLSACASLDYKPDGLAGNHGLAKSYIAGGKFQLASFAKITNPGSIINIYIEGDGNAWSSRTQLSADPSPRSDTMLKLATLDDSPNVLYLARPCQYSPNDLQTVCSSKYWSLARYGNTVISAMQQALNNIKNQYHAESFRLIGYSGGGAIAVLLAARRNDVSEIITLAGNLDLQTMDKHHRSTPLSESLDPIQYAKAVRHVPQRHYVGAKDIVVPAQVALNFARAAEISPEYVRILPSVAHAKGWDKLWPDLLYR